MVSARLDIVGGYRTDRRSRPGHRVDMSKARSNWMAKADVLFAASIRARDGACRKCGSTEFLQCAHIISRSYKAIRVDPRNAVALCRTHHLYYTHHPLEWEAWIEEQYPGRWAWLRSKALQYGKVNWKKEYESLRGVVGT